jgi:hypothetical protein
VTGDPSTTGSTAQGDPATTRATSTTHDASTTGEPSTRQNESTTRDATGQRPPATRPRPSTTTPKPTVVPVVIPPPSGAFVGAFGPFQVQALSDGQQANINQAIDAYVQTASIAPLVSGASANLSVFLTAAAVPEVQGSPARASLTDESVATAPDAQVTDRSVQLDGFIGPDGAAVANATIDITITAASTGLTIHRTGVLMLLPEAGTWKIDSFALHVERAQ